MTAAAKPTPKPHVQKESHRASQLLHRQLDALISTVVTPSEADAEDKLTVPKHPAPPVVAMKPPRPPHGTRRAMGKR